MDSSSELVLVDGLCELVDDGPCELVVDRMCPPIVSPLLAPDWRGSTGMEAECLKKFQVRFVVLPRLAMGSASLDWSYQAPHQVLWQALG